MKRSNSYFSPLNVEETIQRLRRASEGLDKLHTIPCIRAKDRLKEQREKLNLTPREVASACRINESQYLSYERGEKELVTASFRIGLNICYVLQIDPMDFCQAKKHSRK